MSLSIASLNSGSNGNCYYVGNEHEAVLVDAGISCKEIESRMANIDLSMEKVKALFISHEHIDHIRGASVLAKKYELPVYITGPTLKHSGIRLEKSRHFTFTDNESISIGNLTITPFLKEHDAVDPYSFIVEHKGVKVGVITDVGIACKRVIHYFKQCHACFLESNYDEKMLEEGGYTARLKKRIRGGKGHLSNRQALELFLKHKPAFMSHLLLSHLSKNNNHPQIVQDLFSKHSGDTRVIIASRNEESSVHTITKTKEQIPVIRFPAPRVAGVQMSLFN